MINRKNTYLEHFLKHVYYTNVFKMKTIYPKDQNGSEEYFVNLYLSF